MQELSLTHFLHTHLTSALGYAFLVFIVVRLGVSLWHYKSSQDQLKRSLSVIIWLIVAIVYTISPVDLIPDIFLVVGWIDDALILIGSIAFAHSAAIKIFWGDLPGEKRLYNFLLWYFYAFIFCITISGYTYFW
ncbi:MAG: DUF1232 domain-containing protein [Saprospiraceae bacterium]|nr:DUF1232 domain-containing protein [Saprospiraceae bacterium]